MIIECDFPLYMVIWLCEDLTRCLLESSDPESIYKIAVIAVQASALSLHHWSQETHRQRLCEQGDIPYKR